jgi:hypothetical protein
MLIGLVGINQYHNPPGDGQKLPQQSQPLCIYFSGEIIEAGRIAGRPSEARDEAELDRVFGSDECNWYGLSRSFGRHRGCGPGHGDDADLPTSQVGRQFRKPIEPARQPIPTFWPSVLPVSARPRRKAWSTCSLDPGASGLRSPTTGIAGCCARAASGHAAAAPPSSVMNARRLTPLIGFLPPASQPA